MRPFCRCSRNESTNYQAATIGCSSPNGTGFAHSSFAMGMRFSSRAATRNLSIATSRTCLNPFAQRCHGDKDLSSDPFHKRRSALESLLAPAAPPVHITPATSDRKVAEDWFSRFEGAGLDGVIAKSLAGAY